MTIEVQRLNPTTNINKPGNIEPPAVHQNSKQNHETTSSAIPEPEISPEQYLDEILNMTSSFNKKLKFSINRELGQVVVKVLDRETDKVIKEIPPAELQRLHARMKETLGLLFDQKI